MPKHFNINRRLLTDEEKYSRAIFFYTYNDKSFEVVYKNPDKIFDQYGQPQLDVEKNFVKLSDEIKSKVLEFVKREIYDETITMKCLRCNHEETLDWEMIEEMFDERFERYPLLHCPKCGKSKFVPLDIYNEQKL